MIDSMSVSQIKAKYPDEYERSLSDPFAHRYPRAESCPSPSPYPSSCDESGGVEGNGQTMTWPSGSSPSSLCVPRQRGAWGIGLTGPSEQEMERDRSDLFIIGHASVSESRRLASRLARAPKS